LTDRTNDFCPLGTHPLDRRAWKEYASLKDEGLAAKKNDGLTTKEIHERANAKRKWDKKNRHYRIAYQGAYYFGKNDGRKSPRQFVKGELKRLGYPCSRTVLWEVLKACFKFWKEWGIEFPKTNLCRHKEYEVARLVSWRYRNGSKKTIDQIFNEVLISMGIVIEGDAKTDLKRFVLACLNKWQVTGYSSRQADQKTFPKCSGRTIRGKNIYKLVNTAGRGKWIKSIKNLTFALLYGRKPWYPFGQKTSRNDEPWQMFSDCHWDNCKTEYRPKLLFKTVYDLLIHRARKEDILCQYGILVRYYHGLAVDCGMTSFEPIKLVSELKEKIVSRYLS